MSPLDVILYALALAAGALIVGFAMFIVAAAAIAIREKQDGR